MMTTYFNKRICVLFQSFILGQCVLIDISHAGIMRKIDVNRVHGERWFDASLRVVLENRFTLHKDMGCGDDPICMASWLEVDIMNSIDCPQLSRFSVFDVQFGNIYKCAAEDSFCETYYERISHSINPPLRKNELLAVDPETDRCRKERAEPFRVQFYVISSTIAESDARRRFVDYQMARFLDAEDAAALIWETREPEHKDISALRRIEPSETPEMHEPGSHLTLSEGSATWKHYSALKHMVEHKIPVAVIMEDNIAFKASASEAIRAYLIELEEKAMDWDFVFDSDLWGLEPEPEPIHGSRLYVKSNEQTNVTRSYSVSADGHLGPGGSMVVHGSSKGANFYMVRLDAARRIVDSFLSISGVIDHRLNSLFRQLEMTVLWARPPNVHKIHRSSSAVGSCVRECMSKDSWECANCLTRTTDKSSSLHKYLVGNGISCKWPSAISSGTQSDFKYSLFVNGEELILCPRGFDNCEGEEDTAKGVFNAWLQRRPENDPVASDVIRQMLVAAEPYRPTVPPVDACAEAQAPRTRFDLIAKFLEFYGGSRKASYLEIGCMANSTFNKALEHASFALCVDPEAGGSHRMTSDEFFETVPEAEGPWDVVFVDGLHEAGQAERDVRHALARLRPGGLVVMHDTRPRAEVSAAWPRTWPHQPPLTWNGDTYKAAIRLKMDPSLDVVTADLDHGCTLVRPRNHIRAPAAESAPDYLWVPPPYQTWAQFEANATALLGLIAPSDALSWFFARGSEGGRPGATNSIS